MVAQAQEQQGSNCNSKEPSRVGSLPAAAPAMTLAAAEKTMAAAKAGAGAATPACAGLGTLTFGDSPVAAGAVLHGSSSDANSNPSVAASSGVATLQSLQLLKQQRRQHVLTNGSATATGGAPQPAAGGTAPAGAAMNVTAHAAAAAADGVALLLAQGDLTCDVNRWDLLQRGKQ